MQLTFSLRLAPFALLALGACGAGQNEPTPPKQEPITRAVRRETLEGVADGGAATPSASDGGASSYSGHGAGSVPPEIIAKYPPVPPPADVSARIQAMLDLRGASSGRLSPDRKTMFFNWSVTGTVQVFRLDGPQRFPVQLTGGEDVTRLQTMSPDGKWLVIARDLQGEENPGIYLQSPKGGPLLKVAHKPRVQSRVELVSDDSKYLYYTANDIKPDSYAIYRYDLDARTTETVLTEPGLWSIEDHSADGRLLLQKSTGSTSAEFYEWDLGKRTLTPVLGQGETEELSAFYGPGQGELIVTARKNPDGSRGEFKRVYRYSIKDQKLTPIGPELPMDVSAGKDRAMLHLYANYNDGGYSRARVFDMKTWKEIALPKLPGAESTSAGSPSRDGKTLMLFAESSIAPTRAFVHDWEKNTDTEWTLPTSPEVDTSVFTKADLETFPARDGTKVPMFVRRPKNCDKPCPVVVSFHGGPEAQAGPGFSPYAQLFVDAGFVFVEPNVRGSDGYGRTYLHADDGPKRLAVVTDIEDVAKYIRANWGDGGRAPKIGVTGGSYGGYSTLMAMTKFAGAYDAGVSNVGMSSLLSFLMNTAPYRRQLRVSEYGDPEKDRAALLQLSPVTYVDQVKAPLMLIQGANDPRAPVGEAIQMHDALVARGVDTKMIIFPDEGHGAQKRGNRVIQIGATLDFFEQHLKNKPR